MYYIGVDGGGTKTLFTLFDALTLFISCTDSLSDIKLFE